MTFAALISVLVVVIELTYAHTAPGVGPGHSCYRTCVKGRPMTCFYEFEVNKYFTLSKACYNCPYNVTDCFRPGCTTGTGFQRIFYPVNLQLPGPLISVCEHDNIVVDVNNRLGDATTTIHWHGIKQEGTPYQDGVPFVTQCPIDPSTTFRYQFKVNQSGTHFWHSHTSYQIVDGMAGMIIIRQPPKVDPNYRTYDYDLNEHAIFINDFHPMTGDALHGIAFRTNVNLFDVFMPAILVNGRGQIRQFTTGTGANTRNISTPVASFKVKKGHRYRFRLCSNVNLECPTLVTVDNHSMTIIATDGNPVKPTVVNSFIVSPGERYDFVINTNQKIGNYWIRFQGTSSLCSSSYMGAILKYDGSSSISLTNRYQPGGLKLNDQTLTRVVGLEAIGSGRVTLKSKVDTRFYLPFSQYLDFDPLDLPWLGTPTLLPLINGIHFSLPSSPLLSQYNNVDKSRLCNETSLKAKGENCNKKFCSCVYRLKIPLGYETEIVLINTGAVNPRSPNSITLDPVQHDFHLHGYSFYVVAQGTLTLGKDMVEQFKSLDRRGKIRRKLVNPVIKDTVQVPQGGYTVFRFKADNPGFWMFHCHMAFHFEAGMGLVFQVGNPNTDFPPVPQGFPRCGDYKPPIRHLPISTKH